MVLTPALTIDSLFRTGSNRRISATTLLIQLKDRQPAKSNIKGAIGKLVTGPNRKSDSSNFETKFKDKQPITAQTEPVFSA